MFDPNLPQEGTDIDAVQMRSQLNGLKSLIDAITTISGAQVSGTNTLNPGDAATAAVSLVGSSLEFTFGIPKGTEGSNGPMGPPFASAIVESVSTLNPWEPAGVNAFFDGSNVRFSFSIPRGLDGTPGPPFSTAVVDGVTTLDPADNPWVQATFDGSNVHFTFGIPRGVAGLPGEVSNQQLADAVAGTSANTNLIATLDTPFANPDLDLLRQKLNELILNGRR